MRTKKDLPDARSCKIDASLLLVNERIKRLKERIVALFAQNKETRTLREDAAREGNIISVFDSVLTRTLGIEANTLSRDIIVVQAYYFHVLEDIIVNGFWFGGEKYISFTASAGQIRTKKTVFIKAQILEQHQQSLMCGLSIGRINAQGGININKYLAYLALCNSATDEWDGFDIDRAIVVDDMRTEVASVVDFIDENTYEITRQKMNIPINHTDGCGMILPGKQKKSMMIRLPWIKGLLVPFPFDKFIREQNRRQPAQRYGTVTDIYGKQYHLIDDKIEIILTKSQFKLWKYYSSWEEYKTYYKQYKCQAGVCNEEDEYFTDANMSYQTLQTLTDMTDEELNTLCSDTISKIIRIGTDKNTMLKVLGVVKANRNKNFFQQALDIYPELLNDTYSREILKDVKKKLVREARAGKIGVNSSYTFICPDLYAFSEYLVLGRKAPAGLLQNGEVYCALYKDQNKLDCLRSPHLYREHAVRSNVVDKEKSRWFVTDGLYTSVHDPISKILMFDVDGDKSLVCADDTIIRAAERNMHDIVPLYYNMANAEEELITNHNIYKGLTTAYTGGNIGIISNNISKIWNSEAMNLDVIKWLCMENNFTIDYAKTLYKPVRPKEIDQMIREYTKLKLPHFYLYAKDKTAQDVEKPNRSVVNRLEQLIPNPRLNFKAANLGSFDYTLLMSGKPPGLNEAIIDKYTELDRKKRFMSIAPKDGETTSDDLQAYARIRNEILTINEDKYFVVDVLVEYLYQHKKSSHKTTLWSCFGDIIVENLRKHIKEGTIQCELCGKRMERVSRNQKMCPECAVKADREKAKQRMRKKRQFDS
ncbi:RNA dependent RNA polymerase [Paenibacillus oenotherae]|uniref:RNA dependent RNA polymerase n=1 Tax=Paenibacillus oenotherae TaxID=1435645 RepID=UPI001FE77D65|nr:hypothetical protein [Paenibacillus oenotherae]